MSYLTRYWFKFDCSTISDIPYGGLGLGCGVTAYSYQDALFILKKNVFINEDIPLIVTCAPNVDISTLDQGHVIPNLGNFF